MSYYYFLASKASTSICSTFVAKHNHVLHEDINRFASSYCALSKEIFDEIQFYTVAANLDASVQRQLLEAR
jgi:hypothetical protein